eukprot:5869510-Alexandrium_andersonii.AAC.1
MPGLHRCRPSRLSAEGQYCVRGVCDSSMASPSALSAHDIDGCDHHFGPCWCTPGRYSGTSRSGLQWPPKTRSSTTKSLPKAAGTSNASSAHPTRGFLGTRFDEEAICMHVVDDDFGDFR